MVQPLSEQPTFDQNKIIEVSKYQFQHEFVCSQTTGLRLKLLHLYLDVL